ncbi:hypothetical protein ACU4GD_11630 [Cupriavidus basilensis]
MCCNPREDGSFEYVAGVEAEPGWLPPSFRCTKVDLQRYAVFEHAGDIFDAARDLPQHLADVAAGVRIQPWACA